MPVPVALQPRQTSQDWLGQFLETVKPTMKKIANSSRRLSDHISRALNKIRKPSTAGEITELVGNCTHCMKEERLNIDRDYRTLICVP